METEIDQKKEVAKTLVKIDEAVLGIDLVAALIVGACVFCAILMCVANYIKN